MAPRKAAKKRTIAEVKAQDAAPVLENGSQENEGNGFKFSKQDREYIAKKIRTYHDAQVATTKLTAQDLKECCSEVMRHMLASNYKDPNKPVTHTALSGLMKKLQAKQTLIAPAVITRAQSEFTKFGFEMVLVPHGGSSKSYILRSLLPRSFITKYLHTPEDKAMDGLKAILLAYLQLKGGKCYEDELWAYLEGVGFHRAPDRGSAPVHPAFGMPTKAVLDTLVKDKFLRAGKENMAQAEVVVYSLGDVAVGQAAEVTTEYVKGLIQAVTNRKE